MGGNLLFCQQRRPCVSKCSASSGRYCCRSLGVLATVHLEGSWGFSKLLGRIDAADLGLNKLHTCTGQAVITVSTHLLADLRLQVIKKVAFRSAYRFGHPVATKQDEQILRFCCVGLTCTPAWFTNSFSATHTFQLTTLQVQKCVTHLKLEP